MKKSIVFKLILVGLVFGIFPLASQAAPLVRPSWRAEYYDNPSLSGQPRIARWEDGFGHDWGLGSPAIEIPRDHFSARWTNTLHFEKGTYMFFLTVDDGARVWLDGHLIIDAWSIGRQAQMKTKIRIDKTGNYEIQVAYFENVQMAGIQLEWLQLGGENDIVGAWHGEYYNNRDLAGTPVMTRQDSGLSFNWSLGSPHPKVPRDNFSIRWTRSVYLKEGLYNFRIQHDDGMRVYVDGKIIYDSWQDQSVSYTTRQVPLKGGYRTFVVEYYDHIGNAIAVITFDQDPGDYGDYEPGPEGPGLIVKSTSNGFKWGGPTSHRFVSNGGFGGGNFYWTHNTSSQATNYGQWNPGIGEAGNYEVLAYIPTANATTSNARYQIHHYGHIDERSVNQGVINNRFISLGIYYFNGTGNEFVRLHDNTGESAGSTAIAFDTLKFIKQ